MLDVAAMRGHVETGLGDTELGLLIAAAYAAIAERYGPSGAITERRRGQSGPILMLAHRAGTVSAVVEDGTTLAEDDYQLRPAGRLLERRRDGTNPRGRWRGMVDVTYQSAITDAERDRVAIVLVKLDIASQPGVVSERTGEHSIAFAQGDSTYAKEREAILLSLEPDGIVVF